jgi:hypothetical protein
MTLPGTPIPSLVQEDPDDEFTEIPPPTPAEKDEVSIQDEIDRF